MATVRDLIKASLGELVVLQAGEDPSAADAADALATLNRMVNAWQAERVYIYSIGRTTWTITANVGTYTVGTGATVNVIRPAHIDAVNISDSSTNPSYEMGMRLMTDQDYAEVRIKPQTALRPQGVYYNPTYPNGTLTFWPIPTSATLSGVLYAPQAVSEFTGLTQTVSFPPGYERMIVKNLAVELAPGFGANPDQQLLNQAKESLAVVLRTNKRLVEQRFDPGASMWRRYYDIFSDLS